MHVSLGFLCGQDAAEPGEHVEQAGIEAIEHVGWQVGEQLAREPAVTVKECLGSRSSPFGEGDECRAAVGGMRFAGHEEAQFTALRYFALDGTDHPSHKEQASMIRRYIIWRNNHAYDERLRQVVARANVA